MGRPDYPALRTSGTGTILNEEALKIEAGRDIVPGRRW